MSSALLNRAGIEISFGYRRPKLCPNMRGITRLFELYVMVIPLMKMLTTNDRQRAVAD